MLWTGEYIEVKSPTNNKSDSKLIQLKSHASQNGLSKYWAVKRQTKMSTLVVCLYLNETKKRKSCKIPFSLSARDDTYKTKLHCNSRHSAKCYYICIIMSEQVDRTNLFVKYLPPDVDDSGTQ